MKGTEEKKLQFCFQINNLSVSELLNIPLLELGFEWKKNKTIFGTKHQKQSSCITEKRHSSITFNPEVIGTNKSISSEPLEHDRWSVCSFYPSSEEIAITLGSLPPTCTNTHTASVLFWCQDVQGRREVLLLVMVGGLNRGSCCHSAQHWMRALSRWSVWVQQV